MNILALNVGSSSLKFSVYAVDSAHPRLLVEGDMSTGDDHPLMRYREHGQMFESRIEDGDAPWEKVPSLRDLVPFDVVAHRVVHGGPWLREHCLIDSQVLVRIEQAATFAPLHVPPALRWIRRSQADFPRARHVACLDTAFHHPLPEIARVLPVPHAWQEQGVERFGFHGLSCESILAQMPELAPRLVIAHLGSGASLTAVKQGRSVDTSMGMTPTGGIIMGTRPGDLDPGVLLYLLRKGHMSSSELERQLEHEAGLRGLSNQSADVRELSDANAGPLAGLALEHFAQSVARQTAGFAVVLGGLDLLVFTGGIGEHHSQTRDRVVALLRPCFPALMTQTLPSQENHIMARHAWRLTAIP